MGRGNKSIEIILVCIDVNGSPVIFTLIQCGQLYITISHIFWHVQGYENKLHLYAQVDNLCNEVASLLMHIILVIIILQKINTFVDSLL
jgi:hypothetical protein